MEKFEVNILGCGAAIPIGRHMTTSQLVKVYDKLFMVDCGEGTQTQIWKSGIKLTNMEIYLSVMLMATTSLVLCLCFLH